MVRSSLLLKDSMNVLGKYNLLPDGTMFNSKGQRMSPYYIGGYKYITLQDEQKVKHTRPMHTLMWETFRGKFDTDSFFVGFKDGQRDNYQLDNLVLRDWICANNRAGKEIEQLDEQGNVIATYKTVRLAAEANWLSYNQVLLMVSGKTKKMNTGHRFRFKEGL